MTSILAFGCGLIIGLAFGAFVAAMVVKTTDARFVQDCLDIIRIQGQDITARKSGGDT